MVAEARVVEARVAAARVAAATVEEARAEAMVTFHNTCQGRVGADGQKRRGEEARLREGGV